MSYDWGWVTALAAVAAALALLLTWVMLRCRTTPERREKRRRSLVNRQGRLVDGVIVELNAESLFYSYSVAGVGYHASQDVSQLLKYLPDDPARLIGPVWLKYTQRNPANSIVLCEQWSGFRTIKEMQSQ